MENDQVVFIKKKTDPLAIRISIGGNDKDGSYCTFRGEVEDVKKLLYTVYQSFLKNESALKFIKESEDM